MSTHTIEPLESNPPRGQRIAFGRGTRSAVTHRSRLVASLTAVRENATGFVIIDGVRLDESDIESLIERIDSAVAS